MIIKLLIALAVLALWVCFVLYWFHEPVEIHGIHIIQEVRTI